MYSIPSGVLVRPASHVEVRDCQLDEVSRGRSCSANTAIGGTGLLHGDSSWYMQRSGHVRGSCGKCADGLISAVVRVTFHIRDDLGSGSGSHGGLTNASFLSSRPRPHQQES
jgi:hypothetical protein